MAHPNDLSLDELSAQLSQLSTKDAKMEAVSTYLNSALQGPGQRETIVHLAGNFVSHPVGPTERRDGDNAILMRLLKQHGLDFDDYLKILSGSDFDASLARAPCTHVVPEEAWNCPNEGRMICSNCKIVAYCSKDCQRKHWRTHKRDCKDPVRASDWKPAWVREMREPSFVSGQESSNWLSRLKPIALGMTLWGNVPAMDIINLAHNEIVAKDLALAFMASGDLRNLILTVNRLPSDYSGQLTVVLNDYNPHIVLRNVLLLMILGTYADRHSAVDVALHIWYSAFIPIQYEFPVQEALLRFTKQLGSGGTISYQLSSTSSMTGLINPKVVELIQANYGASYGFDDAVNEINRVRFDPSRIDRHHRQYIRLEPSHRLAFLEFRRFGIVLPFGARNDHFNTPNRFLFSPEGTWLQNDLANPLHSWDPLAVVEAGKAHGAVRADLYGCLYFYLSDLLREFADRLGRFRISFRMFQSDAGELSKTMQSGALSPYGLPETTRFDRIDVSNIIDIEYMGILRVLSDWGPLLNSDANKHASLIGYSMNWAAHQQGAKAEQDDDIERSIEILSSSGRIPISPSTASLKEVQDYAGILFAYHHSFTAVYDNSSAFEKYLASQGLKTALLTSRLKRKSTHTIFPHRLCAPLDGPTSALPVFANDESWYLNANVNAPLWSERFVEFSRA